MKKELFKKINILTITSLVVLSLDLLIYLILISVLKNYHQSTGLWVSTTILELFSSVTGFVCCVFCLKTKWKTSDGQLDKNMNKEKRAFCITSAIFAIFTVVAIVAQLIWFSSALNSGETIDRIGENVTKVNVWLWGFLSLGLLMKHVKDIDDMLIRTSKIQKPGKETIADYHNPFNNPAQQ